MKKLVYISSIAAPHQVKLCIAMQKYYDAEFWYYDTLGSRASWWKIDLGTINKVIPDVKTVKSKYWTKSHLQWLKQTDPDILILGGFSIPANYLAYRWAIKNHKKVVVFTERSRDKNGVLRKRGIIWRLLRRLYKDVDMVMVSEADIVPQFRDEFQFGSRVVAARYAADIDSYFAHTLRQPKDGYTYMFPNRLTKLYNPLAALRIFKTIATKYSSSYLIMNALGEERESCENYIKENGILDKVEFLDHIESWDKLHMEYQRSDIMIFPAISSNGNFTIMEAMASGMGIIISDKIRGVGSYIENGVNGFRLPPIEKEFVYAVSKFIDDPSLLIRFAEANRDKVKDLGSDGTAKLYFDLLEKHLFDNAIEPLG